MYVHDISYTFHTVSWTLDCFATKNLDGPLHLSLKSRCLSLSLGFVQNAGTFLGSIIEGDKKPMHRLTPKSSNSELLVKLEEMEMLLLTIFYSK